MRKLLSEITYNMKFDVPGWRNKNNTRHIGFVNDVSTVEKGGFIREGQGAKEAFEYQNKCRIFPVIFETVSGMLLECYV